MRWPDAVLACSSFVFSISLLPMLLNRQTKVPRKASIPTCLGLCACGVADAGLALWLATTTTLLTAGAWGFIAVKREA